LSDSFPIQNGLSTLPFNFASEYAIRKGQENHLGLKLNGTHQLLAYADYVNLLEDNINSINEDTETFIDVIKEVGLEVQFNSIQFIYSFHGSIQKTSFMGCGTRQKYFIYL
jgi:hypothetical protein